MSRPSLRSLAPWLVLALVVLAGCNGVFGSGESGTEPASDGDLTAAPVPNGSDAGTATPDSSDLPSGMEPDRISSVSELRRAHLDAVSDSVTVTVRTSVDGNASGDVVRTHVRNRSTYLRTAGEAAVPVLYADPTGRYSRHVYRGNGSELVASDTVSVSSPRQDAPLTRGLDALPAGPANVSRVERDGTTFVRIHATRHESDRDGSVDSVDVTAYVRPDGFVRTVVEERVERARNESTTILRRVSYDDVGNTTVTEPDWVRAEKVRRGLVDRPPATPAEGAPPGIGEQRLYNASALWDAHRSVLDNRSFAMVRRSSAPAIGYNSTSAIALENETTWAGSTNANVTRYSDPTGYYIRVSPDSGDERVFDTQTPNTYELNRTTGHGGGFLVGYGSSVSRLERNGTVYFRVDMTIPPSLGTPTRNYSATALVRADGFVERLVVEREILTSLGVDASDDAATRSGEWVLARDEFVYRDVGNTTVTEPAWVTRIKRNRTTETPTPEPPTEQSTPTDEPDHSSAMRDAPAAGAVALTSMPAMRSAGLPANAEANR